MKLHTKVTSLILTTAMLLSTSFATVGAVNSDTGINEQLSTIAEESSESKQSSNYKLTASKFKTEDIENPVFADADLPEKYSSYAQGFVTAPKNQGDLGVCWAFSALSCFETYLLKNGYGEYDLSEEHMNHWATLRSDGTGWQRAYDGGGYQSIALGYLTSWQGPKNESDVPYRSGDDKTFEELDNGKTEFGVTGAILLDNNMENIKQAIMDYGSISTSYSALSKFQNSTKTAVCCPSLLPTGTFLNGHSISVVGWNDNYPKSDFNKTYAPKNDGAWLVKNSWGNYNMNQGYFWISYEDVYIFNKNVFGISFAITDGIKIEDNMKMYQNETYGATCDFGLSESTSDNEQKEVDNIVFINSFDFKDKYSTLDSVLIESQSVGSEYKAYYIPVENNIPVQDKNRWTLLANGTIDYSGYIDIDTNDFEIPYSSGAIGIEIDSSQTEKSSTIGCDEWLYGSNGYRFIPNVKKDASFIIHDDTIYNLSDFYSEVMNDSIGSNLVIKAITSADSDIVKGDVNNDGTIDLYDILEIQKHMAEIMTFDSRNKYYSSDTNYDGKTDLYDILQIQKLMAELINEF